MYIDVEIAKRRRLQGLVTIRLNGRIVEGVLSAKSGKDGFVEFCGSNPKVNRKRDSYLTYKKRGLVKLSFNL